MSKTSSKKCVVVIGGTGGIGHAIAQFYADKGYDVVITGRDEQRTNGVAKEIGGINCWISQLRFLSPIVRAGKILPRRSDRTTLGRASQHSGLGAAACRTSHDSHWIGAAPAVGLTLGSGRSRPSS